MDARAPPRQHPVRVKPPQGEPSTLHALRTIVRLRKQDADERREHETILETYMHALGML